jgi:HD-like signal output (HDOD) protein
MFSEQVHIAGLLRKHRQFKNLPIIGYGNQIERTSQNCIIKAGVNKLFDRPLKFTELMAFIEQALAVQKKSLGLKKAVTQTEKDKDLEDILNPDLVASTKLDLMLKYVSRLMAFPFTIAKVLQITNDEKSGAGQLAHAISVDPAIAAHLLRIANSVFFASANRRISSIKDAVVRIGFQETKKIALGMLVMNLFNQKTKNYGFDRVDFWFHSIAAGLFAEQVAKYMKDVNPEEAFLAGLLHDFGVIVFDEFFPDLFEKVLQETSIFGGHFPDQEVKIFGFNHNDVVERLFPTWKMPQGITNAVAGHYKADSFKGNADSPGKKLTLCVLLGNLFAKVANLGYECDQFIYGIENWVLEHANMATGFNENLIENVTKNISMYQNFLSLEKRDFSAGARSREDAYDITIGIAHLGDLLFRPLPIALKAKGYKIVSLPFADESEYVPVSAVVVWSDSASATNENLKPLSGIIKKPGGEAGEEIPEEKPVEIAPVLVIVPAGFSGANALDPNVSIISDCFDLRELEVYIDKIISGEVVRTIKGSVTA